MRHSGVCEGCWIIKLTPLRRNLHDSRHGYDTILSSHTVSAALSLLTADTATDPVYCAVIRLYPYQAARSCGARLHSCEIAPFRMPRLAHVLRAEPQISLRRTGRCPAWDRVDGLGFMHRGRMACSPSPARPVNYVVCARTAMWLYFRDFTTRHWGSHGHYQIKYVRYRSKSRTQVER
jgi:hypothetical protein